MVVNDDKTYHRNNINDLVIQIPDNNNVAQQQGIIFRIQELQAITREINKNIRGFNEKIAQKDNDRDDLIEDGNDDILKYKQKKIIQDKIRNNELEVKKIKDLILEERSKIDKVNVELDYQIERLNMQRYPPHVKPVDNVPAEFEIKEILFLN
jgi:hypothetical protein